MFVAAVLPLVAIRLIAVKLVSFVNVSPMMPSDAMAATSRVSVEVVVRDEVQVPEVPDAILDVLTKVTLSSPATPIALAARAATLGCVTVIVAPDASATVTRAVRMLHLAPAAALPVSVDTC